MAATHGGPGASSRSHSPGLASASGAWLAYVDRGLPAGAHLYRRQWNGAVVLAVLVAVVLGGRICETGPGWGYGRAPVAWGFGKDRGWPGIRFLLVLLGEHSTLGQSNLHARGSIGQARHPHLGIIRLHIPRGRLSSRAAAARKLLSSSLSRASGSSIGRRFFFRSSIVTVFGTPR